MPDIDDSTRTSRKGKESIAPQQQQNGKHVHFDANGKQYPPPPHATSAPNSPAPSKGQPPPSSSSSSSASSKAQGQGAPPPVDNQPASFPQVGSPPGQFGPGQWYTSADPRMSLSQPQYQQYPQYPQQLPSNGGFWQQPGGLPLFANGGPAAGTHFYPAALPPHYAAFNNVCHPQPAYGAVPVAQPGFVVAQQPGMIAQPIATPQPVFLAGQPGLMQATPGPQVFGGGGGGGGPGIPVIAGNSGFPPDVSGLGRTQGEETLRQLQFAHANKLFEPQEFKPADDDPSRFYYVREVDGNWTQRNRFTIDHMGDCRWYVTDEGWFYAVRLPD